MQSGWPARLTQVLAGEIRRYRKERGMSAQELADRCEQLGLAIPRPVLSNLENGRRESVSIAELLVLATALGVSPILLIAPLGRQQAVEVLPGRVMDVWDAVLWFTGQAELADVSPGKPLSINRADEDAAPELFRVHQFLVDRAPRDQRALQHALHQAEHAETEEAAAAARRVADLIRANVETNEEDLRGVRARMRKRGLTPPLLPAPWQAALDEDLHRAEGTLEPSNGRARRQAEHDLEPEAGG